MTNTTENQIIALASKFINQTHCNIFLTGKAGTGKTTFLKNITEQTHKKTIVAAPTGVAAINAGGVTLHSLFQLPFGTFIPSDEPIRQEINIQLNNPKSLLQHFQMNATKRSLLRELELLIIDEASMLRADILDAIDTLLRFIRKQRNVPFGGIQILFIGDLLQLPPVVKHEEKDFLTPYYPEIYFFNAHALKNSKLLYLELEKIYRQSDQVFISLLNKLRDNEINEDDIRLLNKYYHPGFTPDEKEGYIHLTTHNRHADEINKNALKKLPGKSYYFEAMIEGEFGDYMFPLEYQLELKEQAQIMFIKNDYSGEHRYFNGKIGRIGNLSEDSIEVDFNDGSDPVSVEPYVWENKKFSLNRESNEIEEKVAGTFTHYPIKLAWAITVHKSQGLTFDKAVIDISKAFAPGQIYVALSRLTSLNGLVLTEPVKRTLLSPDKSLKEFAKNWSATEQLEQTLKEESLIYLHKTVKSSFNFNWLANALLFLAESYNKDDKKSPKQQFKSWCLELKQDFIPVKETADRFLQQIDRILQSKSNENLMLLHERVLAATGYFDPVFKNYSARIFEHLSEVKAIPKTKKYLAEIAELERLFFSQQEKIHKSETLILDVLEDKEFSKEAFRQKQFYQERNKMKHEEKKKAVLKKNTPKPNTKEISFQLYKQGKSIAEIARERSFAISTIEGHLAHYVAEGLLSAGDFVPAEKIDLIVKTYKELDAAGFKTVKDALGENFSYSEIRFAVAGIKE